jgi:ribosomal protein S12 methylthiotransferase
VRSTFIVGFPGETEQEFETLLGFVERARFEHLGVFTYSHEEHTPAHGLADDVPPALKQERRERVMLAQQRIVLRRNERRIGRVIEALVEGPHPETDHLLVARARWQAPEVDGCVLVNEGIAASPGEFVRIELTESAGYDLVGRIVGRA